MPRSAGCSKRCREDRRQLVSLLLQSVYRRSGLKARFSDNPEPELALVGFFSDGRELGDKQRSSICATCRTVVRSNRGAGLQQLLAQPSPGHRVGQVVAELHDSDRVRFGSGFQRFRSF
jgi:hypothetical protein